MVLRVVPDRGELIAIKKAELTPAGRLHRYSWEHLEDEHGCDTACGWRNSHENGHQRWPVTPRWDSRPP